MQKTKDKNSGQKLYERKDLLTPNLLLFSLFALGITTYVTYAAASSFVPKVADDFKHLGLVLGDDDEDDDKDDDKDEDDDDDKDEDKDDDRDDDKNDDKDEEDDDDKAEKENEKRKEEAKKEASHKIYEKRKAERKVETNKQKTTERVTNVDGTYSIIEKEIEGTETKYKVKTYDANNNLIGKGETETKDGETKSESKTYDTNGNTLTEVKLESKDGKKLELKTKQNGTESKVKFDAEKQELEIETEDNEIDDDDANELNETENTESKLKIKVVGDSFEISRKGINAQSKFPLVVDETTGAIFVKTPNGEVKLGAMPDTIVEKAKTSSNLDTVDSVELDDSVDETDDTIEFTLTGTKSQNLFGVFEMQIPTTVTYDANTGEFIKSDQTLTNRIIDLFSF